MTNDIVEYPVPLLFKLIGRRKCSGQLVIRSKGSTRRLYFNLGKLEAASSDIAQERLVEMLLLSGILTRDQAVKVKAKFGKKDTTKAGRILVSEGILTEKKLYECLIAKTATIAASVFGLKEGLWEFIPGQPDLPEGQSFKISLPKVIVKGARQISDLDHYRNMFGRCVLKTVKLPEKTKKLLAPFELKFLSLIASWPGETVTQIVAGMPFSQEIAWREIIKLYLLNGLEFIDTDKWASNTETLIRAQIDLGKTRESPPPKARSARSAIDPESTASTEEARTEQNIASAIGVTPRPALESSSSQRSANVIYRMAEKLYHEGKYREAALILNRAVRPESSPASHILLLGICQSKIPQMKNEAEKHLKIAAERDPQSPDPHFALGDLYRATGMTQQALDAYRRALKIYQSRSRLEKEDDEEPQRKKKLFFPLRKK